MQALILAAGNGTRLRPAIGRIPKCLASVGGRPLIVHQMAACRELGIEDVCVVIGYHGDAIQSALDAPCQVIRNDRHLETNSLYSLWLARNWVRGGFLLMNGDVFADPRIYQDLLAALGSALAYDSMSGDDEEHMKVSLREDGTVHRISKSLPSKVVRGENVGVLKFEAAAVRGLFDAAAGLLDEGGLDEWAPAAVDRLAASEKIHAVDVAGLPWVEVDFPEDLATARADVQPTIEAARRERRLLRLFRW